MSLLFFPILFWIFFSRWSTRNDHSVSKLRVKHAYTLFSLDSICGTTYVIIVELLLLFGYELLLKLNRYIS